MGLQNITNQSIEAVTESEGAIEKNIHDARKDFGIDKCTNVISQIKVGM